MKNANLQRLLTHPRRRAFVTIVTCAIFLATVWPVADEYTALADREATLRGELAVAHATNQGLERLETRVNERMADLERSGVQVVSQANLPQFRERVVQLARETGCGLRRIQVGEGRPRRWHENDDPLQTKTPATRGPETPYELVTRSVSLTVSGRLTNVKALLARLHAQDKLVHTRTLSIRPTTPDGTEVVLEIELWLFDLTPLKSGVT